MAINTTTFESTLQTKLDDTTLVAKDMLLLGKALEATTGNIAVSDVTTAGATQVTAVNNAGTAKLASIAASIGSSDVDFSDNVISQAELKDYSETVVAMAANDIDLATGNVHTKAISGSVTLTFSNPPVSGKAGAFTLICTMSGTPVITWPTGVDWAGAEAPTLSTTGKDIFTFLTTDGGTTWYGFTAGQEMS